MSEIKNQCQLRLIPCGDEATASKTDPLPIPAAIKGLDSPLLRQLTALADAIDRDVAAILCL